MEDIKYSDLVEKKKAELEGAYAFRLAHEDIEGAYSVLCDLVKYRLIDSSDPRLSKKYKLFKNVEGKGNLAEEAQKTNILPLNILVELPNQAKLELTAEEHCSKRMEGSYSGDVLVPERGLPIKIRQCLTVKEAERELENFALRYQEHRKKSLITAPLMEDLLSGRRKIYKVEIDLNVPVTCRQLGSVIVTTNEQEGILVILVNLYHTALKSDFIKMDVAYKAVAKALTQSILAKGGQEKLPYSVRTVAGFSQIAKEQQDLDKIRLEDTGSMKTRRETAEVIIPSRGKRNKHS